MHTSHEISFLYFTSLHFTPHFSLRLTYNYFTTAYRLKCQGEWRNAGSGHTKLAFLQKYPYTLNQDRILKKYQMVKSYKIRIPTRQDWQSQKQSLTTMWTIGTQMGQEYRTALGQVYMDPHMTIGKAYLWEAFPRYFLLK
jgi:hypothetical protein